MPYSGERFRIPPNVHLIGTLNTADGSIALVDLDLRRGLLIYANDDPIQYSADFHGVALDAQALSLHGSLEELTERCREFAERFAGKVTAGALE